MCTRSSSLLTESYHNTQKEHTNISYNTITTNKTHTDKKQGKGKVKFAVSSVHQFLSSHCESSQLNTGFEGQNAQGGTSGEIETQLCT